MNSVAERRDEVNQTTNLENEHVIFNRAVGAAIRLARQKNGWTQAGLAERAELSPNYIARLERGELGPSLFVARKLSAALGIVVDVLVEEA